MSLLEQTPEERQADAEAQAELRRAALESGRVPQSKDERMRDWLSRSMGETEALLAGDPDNVELRNRLAHFREGYGRLTTIT